MAKKQNHKGESPYHLRRGDVITLFLNQRKKKFIILSKKDRQNDSGIEPLFVESRLCREIERKVTKALLGEIKDSKGNVILIKSIKRV